MNHVDRLGLKRGKERRERRVPEELMIARYIPEKDSPTAMYDLGVGVFSEFITLKKVYPNMEVFGCEPCLAEYEDLLPIFTGKLLRLAIGKEHGNQTLYATPVEIGGSSLLFDKGATSRPTEEVVVWTLDEFDDWAGRPDKILLWMDIEGSEMDALIGGHNLLKSGRVHWINLESRDVEHAGHPTTSDLTTYLNGYGYKFITRYNVQGAYPEAAGDNIYFKSDITPNHVR